MAERIRFHLDEHIDPNVARALRQYGVKDRLERMDIENAVLKGRIEKKLTHDVRGTRYRLEGHAKDGRLIHVICRLKEKGSLIIITVYAVMEEI